MSATPNDFDQLIKDVTKMQTSEPNFTKQDLMDIRVPVTIVQSERDEFIKIEHARYLARSIRNAKFVQLHKVSHFAPLQRPNRFNEQVLTFLRSISF